MTLLTTGGSTVDDGTYLVTGNGHGDTIGLAEIHPITGVLTAAARVSYSTWGTPTVTAVNGYGDLGFRYLYVGRFDVQWDDFASAGLHYMHARHYHPEFGRFLQPDPSALEANLYGYTENSPVSRIDPSGDLSCLALLAAMAGGPPGWLTNAACWGIAGLLAMAAYAPLQIITGTMVRAAEKAVRQNRRVDAECIVIGEGMTRVIARARILGCDRYFGVPAQLRNYYKNKDVLLKRRAYLRHNRTWLQGKVGRQHLVVDIGPDFPARRSGQRNGLSGYYFMEYMISRQTPGYIRAWDEPGKTIWSHVPKGRFEW